MWKQSGQEAEDRASGRLLDAVPHVAWLGAATGHVIRWNRAALDYFHEDEAALVGDGWWDAVHPDDRSDVRAAWPSRTSGEEGVLVEARLRRGSDGAWRWHCMQALAQRDEDGGVLRFIGTCTDVHEWKAAEALAKESERRFRATFEQAPLGIAVVDEDGRLREVNDGLCRMLGYRLEELQQLGWVDAVHEQDRAEHVAQSRRLASGAIDGYSLEQRFVRRDGSEVWGRLNAARLGDDGRAGMCLCLLEDVTARRRAEEARRESEETLRQRTAELETIYATAPVGLALVDRRGFVVRANRAQLEGLGFSASLGAVGQPLLPQVPAVQGYIQAVVASGAPVVDAVVMLADASHNKRFLRCSFVALRDATGRVDRVSCTLYDVTQHRRYEAALEEASRQKDHFLAVLGHELRNPLAAISTASELLKRLDVPDRSVERVRAIVERQAAHMTKLVDGLLDVSRIARGKILLERRRVDITRLIHAVVEDRSVVAQAKGLTLTEDLPDAPVWIEADVTRVSQVVDNLLTNAVKFTDPGGVVSVTLEANEDTVSFSVRDTGAGIPREMLEELFEPFRQADRTVECAAGGLGLGLALVRGIVELHGGQVSAHSDGPGQGAELRVRLPRVQPAMATESETGVRREDALRVLVVEDERDTAEILRRALARAGHDVRVVHDARAALVVGQGFSPHVILTDIGLPGMTGYDLARAVRADQHLHTARLVAVTGLARDVDRDDAFAAGFDAHVTKPVDVSAIEGLLQGHGDVRSVPRASPASRSVP